jgi:hypothetical protein
MFLTTKLIYVMLSCFRSCFEYVGCCHLLQFVFSAAGLAFEILLHCDSVALVRSSVSFGLGNSHVPREHAIGSPYTGKLTQGWKQRRKARNVK